MPDTPWDRPTHPGWHWQALRLASGDPPKGARASDDRQALAAQQAALVEALAGAAGVPTGMDQGRVRLAARSLHPKRARGVEKTWPTLRDELGQGFAHAFARYARQTPLPAGGAVEDGAHFAEWLLREGTLGDLGRKRLVMWRARRGWPVRTMGLKDTKRVVVALRLKQVWSTEFRAPKWPIALAVGARMSLRRGRFSGRVFWNDNSRPHP
jgi:hypothetical protein